MLTEPTPRCSDTTGPASHTSTCAAGIVRRAQSASARRVRFPVVRHHDAPVARGLGHLAHQQADGGAHAVRHVHVADAATVQLHHQEAVQLSRDGAAHGAQPAGTAQHVHLRDRESDSLQRPRTLQARHGLGQRRAGGKLASRAAHQELEPARRRPRVHYGHAGGVRSLAHQLVSRLHGAAMRAREPGRHRDAQHVRAAPEQAPELAVERGVVHGLRPQHRAATQQRVVRAVLALVRLVAANAVHQVVHGDDVAAQRGRLCARKARGAVAHDGDGPRRAAALRPTVRSLAHASYLPIFRNLSYRSARRSSVPIAPSSASSS